MPVAVNAPEAMLVGRDSVRPGAMVMAWYAVPGAAFIPDWVIFSVRPSLPCPTVRFEPAGTLGTD